MPLFSLDTNLCNKDGLCAADCPVSCINFAKGEYPTPNEHKLKYCIECGHCVAVCPTGALKLDILPEDARAIDPQLMPGLDSVEHLLKSRRSVRAYKQEPLDRALLERLLAVGDYAPSGHNARPVCWTVLDTPEKVHEIGDVIAEWMRWEVETETPLAKAMHLQGVVRLWEQGVDIICRNAPCMVIAHGPKRGMTPFEDAVIAVSYLEVAATAAGVGSCWCGYLNAAAQYSDEVKDALGILKRNKVYGSLMLGWPKRKYHSIPPRKANKVDWL